MKIYIYIYSILIILIIGCSNKLNVYTDDSISKNGIDIWQESIRYVDMCQIIYKMDICMKYRPDHSNRTDHRILGSAIKNWDSDDTTLIMIYTNNDVVIAHEFGHALGYSHNDNTNSIMHSKTKLNRQLESFKEFRN